MRNVLVALGAAAMLVPFNLHGQPSREIVWMPGGSGGTYNEAIDEPTTIWVWGDYSEPPGVCQPEAMVRRLDAFFQAVSAGDLGLVAEFFADAGRPGFQWYTMSGPGTGRVEIRDIPTLMSYFSERFRQGERMVLHGLSLNRWSGKAANFGPVIVTRSALDMPGEPRIVTGKGAIECATGRIIVLSLGTSGA